MNGTVELLLNIWLFVGGIGAIVWAFASILTACFYAESRSDVKKRPWRNTSQEKVRSEARIFAATLFLGPVAVLLWPLTVLVLIGLGAKNLLHDAW